MAIEFKISHSKEMYKLITSNLYTNKFRAILRELCSNSYDSHIKAGTEHIPIEVNITPIKVSVKDFGTGLSPEAIEGLYTTIFASDKTYDDTQNGAFGVGSKSPFAYASSFAIESRFKGRSYLYMAQFVGDVPSIVDMMPGGVETSEADGVEIYFDLKHGDYSHFKANLRLALSGIPNIQLTLGHETEAFDEQNSLHLLFELEEKFKSKEGDVIYFNGFKKINYEKLYSSAKQTTDCYLLIGNVYYEVNQLRGSEKLYHTYALKGNIGEYEIAASRENVQLTQDQINDLNDRIVRLDDEVQNISDEFIDSEFGDKEYHEVVALFEDGLGSVSGINAGRLNDVTLSDFMKGFAHSCPSIFRTCINECYNKIYSYQDEVILNKGEIPKFVDKTILTLCIEGLISRVNEKKGFPVDQAIMMTAQSEKALFNQIGMGNATRTSNIGKESLCSIIRTTCYSNVFIVDRGSLPVYKSGQNKGLPKKISSHTKNKIKSWCSQENIGKDKQTLVILPDENTSLILEDTLGDLDLLAYCGFREVPKVETVSINYFKLKVKTENGEVAIGKDLSKSMTKNLIGARVISGYFGGPSSSSISSLENVVVGESIFYDSYEGLTRDRFSKPSIQKDGLALNLFNFMADKNVKLVVVKEKDLQDLIDVAEFKGVHAINFRDAIKDAKTLFKDYGDAISPYPNFGEGYEIQALVNQSDIDVFEAPAFSSEGSYGIGDYVSSCDFGSEGRQLLAKNLKGVTYKESITTRKTISCVIEGDLKAIRVALNILSAGLELYLNKPVRVLQIQSDMTYLQQDFYRNMVRTQDEEILKRLTFLESRSYRVMKEELTVAEAELLLKVVGEP